MDQVTLVTAPSAFAPTGGTNLVLTPMTSSQANKARLAALADTEYKTRRTAEFSVKEPVSSPTAPGGYTQCRATSFIKIPLELENGNVTVNTVSVQVAYDPETDAAGIAQLLDLAAQTLTNADTRAIFTQLSLA
jgi:hypothetical protein